MPAGSFEIFTDPHEHQKAIRAADIKFLVTGAGQYQAKLTRISLHRLSMQRSYTSVPHIMHSSVTRERSVIFFRPDTEQAPMYHQGVEISATDLVFNSTGSEHYRRMPAVSGWASMSLKPEDLAAAGQTLAGYEVTAPATSSFLRPPDGMMSRLMKLHRDQARRALALADPTATTITNIATEHGFWELGRFSVAYRNLFGERPSETLHRAA